MNPDLSARIALITGASSGMGGDYARELASRGVSLVLVARRAEPLELLAQELRGRFSVAIHVMPTDLANETARQSLHDQLRAAGMTIDLLINNAGFGLFGPFAFRMAACAAITRCRYCRPDASHPSVPTSNG